MALDYFQFVDFIIKQPVFTTLIGVLVGSLLTYFAQTSNEKRKERRQDESIKVWLKIEIDRNVTNLKNLCLRIKNREIPFEVVKYAEIETLAYLDILTWKKDIWDEKNPLIPMALSADEIDSIVTFYLNLENVSSLHLRIKNQQDEFHHACFRHSPNYKHTNSLEKVLLESFDEFKIIVNNTLILGEEVSLKLAYNK